MKYDEQYYRDLYRSRPGKYLNPPGSIKEAFFCCRCFGYHYEDSSLHLKRRDFGDDQILFTVYGGGHILTCGQEFDVYPGSVAIVDCNRYHEYTTIGKCWCMYFFHCSGKQVPAILDTIIRQKSRMFRPHNFERLIWEFQKIYDIRCSDDFTADVLTSNWLSNMFTLLLETPCEDWYSNALHYIHDHFREAVTIEDIEEISHMNKTSFIRAFHKRSGFSPYRYVLNLRIQLAQRLFHDFPERTVSDVAAVCGFESTSGFCQAFKSMIGMTPTEYKMAQQAF